MSKSLYQQITDKIIEQIESGVPPWRKPWTSTGGGMPRNIATKKHYRGLNILLLWDAAQQKGFSSNRWGTYKQWQAVDGQVRRGERATKITFWKTWKETVHDRATGEDREEKRFLLREFSVFNLDQCDGESLDRFRPVMKPKREFIDFQPAEELIAATGAEIQHGGGSAAYNSLSDRILMPCKTDFEGPESYYSTALHELGHWTGHTSRLDRLKKLSRFGDSNYAVEELVAEMSSAFVTATLGIPNAPIQDNAAYLKSWLDVLRSDSRAIITASTKASEAADFLLAFSPRKAETEQESVSI